MIEDKNTVTQETLEDARQKASTLAEILFLGLFQAPFQAYCAGDTDHGRIIIGYIWMISADMSELREI